jgi:hypothetical protein
MKTSFWFHYNKPASTKSGKPQITIHHKKSCIIVDNVICKVPTMGRIRKTQPRWVVAGKANDIKFENNVAIIS